LGVLPFAVRGAGNAPQNPRRLGVLPFAVRGAGNAPQNHKSG